MVLSPPSHHHHHNNTKQAIHTTSLKELLLFARHQQHQLQPFFPEEPPGDGLKRLLRAAGVRRVVSANRKGGIQWLFQAARQQEEAARKSHNTILCSPAVYDPWDFNAIEDTVDDPFLFTSVELAKRRHPPYRAEAAKLHDLHIVLPVICPQGKIIVENPQGANFYQLDHKKDYGAHILFGRGVAEVQSGSPSSSDDELKPVCDVWASFLNIRLGSIYNLTAEQVGLVSDLFRTAFDKDLCRFYVPIAIDCRGVYPSEDLSISQRASRPSSDGQFFGGPRERYETRAVPVTENDLKRLRMIRRHVRKLALKLIHEYNFNRDTPHLGQPMFADPLVTSPVPRVELHDNIKSSTLLEGSMKIVVREWSPLTDAGTFRQVWAKQLSEDSIVRNSWTAQLQTKLLSQKNIPTARVLTGEIRLEHNHLRMVDPRWPDELVPGRRIADHCPESEAPGPENTFGRFVFCSSVTMPPVDYAYVAPGEDPRGVVIVSKLTTLYKIHLSRHPCAGAKHLMAAGKATTNAQAESASADSAEAGADSAGADSAADSSGVPVSTAVGKAETTTTTTTSSSGDTNKSFDAVAPPFIPLPTPEAQAVQAEMPAVLRKVALGEYEDEIPDDRSAVIADASSQGIRLELCKFYLQDSGCARGVNCRFWHPADTLMRSPLDIRQVAPRHPKFF